MIHHFKFSKYEFDFESPEPIDEIFDRTTLFKNRTFTQFIHLLYINNIYITNSKFNREQLKEFFNRNYVIKIGCLFLYSQIDFYNIGINYEDFIKTCNDTPMVNFIKKHLICHGNIPSNLSIIKNDFEWVNKKYKIFIIKNCKSISEFDLKYAPKYGYGMETFRHVRQKMFKILIDNRNNCDFITCIINDSKVLGKRKRIIDVDDL